MNRISIHPASLVLGLIFGVLILISMSQTPPLNARTVNVQYLPDPRDMVQIREGTPYTVPAGKVLVITGLGATSTTSSNNVGLNIDGQVELQTYTAALSADTPSVHPVPQGFTAQAGSTVAIAGGGSNNGRAWGYIAPQ